MTQNPGTPNALVLKATFVFIHRHPYEVFQSAVHMADAYYWVRYR
jgi:hypothetical protein